MTSEQSEMRQFEKDNSTSNSLNKSIPEEGEDEVSTATMSSTTTTTTTTGEPTLQRRATPRIIPRRKMSFPAVSISTPQMKQQVGTGSRTVFKNVEGPG